MEPDLKSAIELLSALVRTPSFSREEKMTADIINEFFQQNDVTPERSAHNIWVVHPDYKKSRPTVLLNSHHDTVKPNKGYSRDPYEPGIYDGKLYGLGSNDAGGSLVCLLLTFMKWYNKPLTSFNLVMAATAEEEISGTKGIESILGQLPPISMGIIGEPTDMEMAIAEKGLLVLDCISRGKSGHAARDEGINAIYEAIQDMEWFRSYQFQEMSPTLGHVRMNVTLIQGGTQHNVIPDECHFTVDVRTTDKYTLEETLEIIKKHVSCEVNPRSVRLRPSGLPEDHVLIDAAKELNITTFGSPTMSDQALMPFPTVKIGPGNSARSHSADEYIFIKQLEQGLQGYGDLLTSLNNQLTNQ